MPGPFKLLPGGRESENKFAKPSAERMLFLVRSVNNSVLQDALDTWGDMWDQLEGKVTTGVLIEDKAGQVLKPECGWPEFLEKMWLLRHHLEYAKRLAEGRA